VSGERFGPYLVEGLLGTGGMGEVHQARDLRKDRVVALKRLHRHLAADPAFRDRFRRESQVVARLSDVHVVPIHDYGEIDGRLFIDMALIRGVDLTSLIDAHPRGMPPGRPVHLLSQVAGALDTAHRAGLVHRDVKPSNVLVTEDHGAEFAYLVDFGIARGVAEPRLTETGSAVGTLT
jgi:serine/threonine kinase PknH